LLLILLDWKNSFKKEEEEEEKKREEKGADVTE
jgi:hypothetical protein